MKTLTFFLSALALAFALALPAQADSILIETYTRTQTKQHAERIAQTINQGQVPGWSMAEVYYDSTTRSYVVAGAHDQDSLDPE